MRKPLALAVAVFALTGCTQQQEPVLDPPYIEETFPAEETPQPVTSTPESELPEPVTSPPPADAPKLLDTSARVMNLTEIEPDIAQAYGFLNSEYYPLTYDPNTYCAVADVNNCATEGELWMAVEDDLNYFIEQGGLEGPAQ